ncbi:Argininosuccinate lyase [Pseudomonas savastanoi pv. glycinea]|nr:Argininosuccinate lyase [Pseudomonas savastanoi pv. glycinea]
MSTDKTNQSWGGRFSEPVDAFVARFTASVTFDQRLYRHDIMGSIAHATMLAKVGVLTDAERDTIVDGLNTIQTEIEAGNFEWRVDLEDVHMNIEARLTDRIGITGKKLHTGRSRNDQVATDIRLWLRDEIDLILSEITRLQQGLLGQAEREEAGGENVTADAVHVAHPERQNVVPGPLLRHRPQIMVVQARAVSGRALVCHSVTPSMDRGGIGVRSMIFLYTIVYAKDVPYVFL